MTTGEIRCFTITDPQVQNLQPEEFCLQQPQNIAFQRAEPQDKDKCKTALYERGLTFGCIPTNGTPARAFSRQHCCTAHTAQLSARSGP